MELRGIDVSEHNGNIDWGKVKNQIDFAIIRAGYGKNNIDKQAENNVWGCIEKGIPFGLFWFSYATTLDMVKKEADYLCDFADKCHPNFPLCFDWEYESDAYAKKQGVTITNELRRTFAKTFLDRVEERGYYAVIYSNPDYLNKGFKELVPRYDLWLAHWGVNKPSVECCVWQNSNIGTVDGITGLVDTDISYIDYTKYCKPVINDIIKELDEAMKNLNKDLDEVNKLLKLAIDYGLESEAGKVFIDRVLN